jgi:hypothetical protein
MARTTATTMAMARTTATTMTRAMTSATAMTMAMASLLAALATGCGAQPERITVDLPPAAVVRAVPAPRAPHMLPSPTGPCVSLDEWNCHSADEDPSLEWWERCQYEDEEVDIDGTPPMDLIANIGDCSNRQVCDYMVLQGCEGGGYRAVLGPIVANSLDVLPRSPRSPVADILSFQGVCASALGLLEIHRWNGTAWTHNEACVTEENLREYRGVGFDPSCADGTPICSAEMEREVNAAWERR